MSGDVPGAVSDIPHAVVLQLLYHFSLVVALSLLLEVFGPPFVPLFYPNLHRSRGSL